MQVFIRGVWVKGMRDGRGARSRGPCPSAPPPGPGAGVQVRVCISGVWVKGMRDEPGDTPWGRSGVHVQVLERRVV